MGVRGFTLIEIVAVLIIIGILAVTALPRYTDLQTQSGQQAARGLLAAAQGQLSLDFARRTVSGLSVNQSSQDACNLVISTSGNIAASVTCIGNLDETVVISAVYDSYIANGSWASPMVGGS